MTVTGVERINSSKSKVYLDGEFAFVLYRGELNKYGIEPGSELSQAFYLEIGEQVLPRRAKLRCMNLLKSRDYTEKQLRDKLREGGYPERVLEEAVAYVKSYGYLDDERYARSYVEYYKESRTVRQMSDRLRKKGISREIIAQVMAQLEESGEKKDELCLAMELLEKKKYNPSEATIKDKQRLSAYLYRKGFGMDTIYAALSLDITPI